MTRTDTRMQNYLVVSALLENSGDIIKTFSRLAKTSGCRIVDSRFSALGNELAVMLFLGGSWDAIAKIEAMLEKLSREQHTPILRKRTGLAERRGDSLPYAVDVVGAHQAGLLFDIAGFMAQNALAIQELTSSTYEAAQTGAAMFALHMTIKIPIDTSIAALRGDFMDFCDHLNLDAIMEPVK